MPVEYDGQSLIPAPLVTLSKSFIRDNSGRSIRPQHVITLEGTIVNVGTNKDSPGAQTLPGGDPREMEDILLEQQRIRQIFSEDGKLLSITTPISPGSGSILCYPIVDSVTFSPSTWTQRCDYSISLTAASLDGDDDTDDLNSFNEEWGFDEQENGTYLVSHNLQAEGAIVYGSGGINDARLAARNWCNDHRVIINESGILVSNHSGSIDFTNLISNIDDLENRVWNYQAIETVGSINNSWQLAENFLYVPSGDVVEEYSATWNSDIQKNLAQISIQGSITGCADRLSNISSRNIAAASAFDSIKTNLYLRAIDVAEPGFTVFPDPNSRQIVKEVSAGIIRYAYSFNATSGTLIPDAIEESISINDTGHTDVFAQIPIPGRANGPVVQNMSTRTLPERSVNISATLKPIEPPGSAIELRNQYLAKPNVHSLLEALQPASGMFYMRENTEQWNPLNRQYVRSIAWVMQPEGAHVDGVPSGVSNLP